MTEFSPAAKAIWNAAWEECPVECGNIIGTRRKQIAAALRAAADEVAPKDVNPSGDWTDKDEVRYQLLAIAAELESDQ